MSAVDELEDESQAQHQRLLALFGANPASGEGFTEVSTVGRQVGQQVQEARAGVVSSNFSTSVVPAMASATRSDHVPFSGYAQTATTAAQVADASADVNRQGAADVLANSRTEAAQVAAIPDRDSPDGMIATLNSIDANQAKSLQTVEQSAAAEQALAQRAAGAAHAAGFQHGPLPQDPSTPTTTTEPPRCEPKDQADLIKKLAEWCHKRDELTTEITKYDRQYPPGHAFNMNDPYEKAEYERGQELRRERGQLIHDYGELLKDVTTCGATQDEATGDILWPDGTRTTLRPPK